MSNRVDIGRSETGKEIGSAGQEGIEKDEHLAGVSFRFMVDARSVRRFIRRRVRLF